MRLSGTYQGYSIERERDGSYSLYRIGNSMHDVHNGFKSIEAAKAAVDAYHEYNRDLALRIRDGQVGSGMKHR